MDSNRLFGTPLNVQNVSAFNHGQSTDDKSNPLGQKTPIEKMRAFQTDNKENSMVSGSPIITQNGHVNFEGLNTPQVLASNQKTITCLPVPISHPSHPGFTGIQHESMRKEPCNFQMRTSQKSLPEQNPKIEMSQMDWEPKTQFQQSKEQPYEFGSKSNNWEPGTPLQKADFRQGIPDNDHQSPPTPYQQELWNQMNIGNPSPEEAQEIENQQRIKGLHHYSRIR